MFFAAGPLEHAIVNKSLGWDVPEDKKGFVGYGSYDQTLSAIETHLEVNDFICGKYFTAADVYVGSHVLWGLQFKTLPELSTFKAYSERLIPRKAYQRCKQINDEKLIQKK